MFSWVCYTPRPPDVFHRSKHVLLPSLQRCFIPPFLRPTRGTLDLQAPIRPGRWQRPLVVAQKHGDLHLGEPHLAEAGSQAQGGLFRLVLLFSRTKSLRADRTRPAPGSPHAPTCTGLGLAQQAARNWGGLPQEQSPRGRGTGWGGTGCPGVELACLTLLTCFQGPLWGQLQTFLTWGGPHPHP